RVPHRRSSHHQWPRADVVSWPVECTASRAPIDAAVQVRRAGAPLPSQSGMSVEGPERFTGGCLCGSVRIVASGRPYRVGVCHCLETIGPMKGVFALRAYQPSRPSRLLARRPSVTRSDAVTMQALLVASAVWSLLCPVVDPDGHQTGKFRWTHDSARECEEQRREIVDSCLHAVPREIVNGRRDYMLICTASKPGKSMLGYAVRVLRLYAGQARTIA